MIFDDTHDPEGNPWRRLATSELYANPWFSVRDDTVIRPDGVHGTYTVVHAQRLATGIMPLWDDGTITLVGQFRYPLNEYSWELPEGGGDPDIDPEVSARRELLEETGIRAQHMHYLGHIHTSNCFLDEVGHLYLATGLEQGQPDPDPDEVLTTRRVSLDEAEQMGLDGRITDAISIACLFRAIAHLRGGVR